MKKFTSFLAVSLLCITFFNFNTLIIHAATDSRIPNVPENRSDLEITEINPTDDIVTPGEDREIELQIENKGPGIANNFVLSGSEEEIDHGKLIDISEGNCTSTNPNDIIIKASSTEFKLFNIAVGSKLKCVFHSSFNKPDTTDNKFSRMFEINKNETLTALEKSYDDIVDNNFLAIAKFIQKDSFDISYEFDKNPITVVRGVGKEINVKIDNLDSDGITHFFLRPEFSLNVHPFPGVTVRQIGCKTLKKHPERNEEIYHYSCNDGFILVPTENPVELTLLIYTDNTVPDTFKISDLFRKINFVDPNPSNDLNLTVNANSPRIGDIDLSVNITDNTDKYVAGLPVNSSVMIKPNDNSFTITVSNNSNNDVIGGILKIPKSQDQYYIEHLRQEISTGNIVCGDSTSDKYHLNPLCKYPQNEFQVNFNLEAHSKFTLTMDVDYSIKDKGPITISAFVEAPESVFDTDLLNNTANDINNFDKKVEDWASNQYDLSIDVSTDRSDRLLREGDSFEDTINIDGLYREVYAQLKIRIPEGVELTGITCQPDTNQSCNLSSPYFVDNTTIYPISSGTLIVFEPKVSYSLKGIPVTFHYKVTSNFKKDTAFEYSISGEEYVLAFDYNHKNNQATIVHKVLPPCICSENTSGKCNQEDIILKDSANNVTENQSLSNLLEKVLEIQIPNDHKIIFSKMCWVHQTRTPLKIIFSYASILENMPSKM